MQALNPIELAGRLSEMRVIQRSEQEAKRSAKNAGKDEKSAIKKQRDTEKVTNRRKLEEAIEDKEYREFAGIEL